MKLSPAIQELIEALRHLPGVGPKSAQRMTLHLLERDREAAQSRNERARARLDVVERSTEVGYMVFLGNALEATKLAFNGSWRS